MGLKGVMQTRDHWDSVYEHKGASQVSWYRPHLERSLRFIEGAGLGHDAAIIDVGGGASTLVDEVLSRFGRKSSSAMRWPPYMLVCETDGGEGGAPWGGADAGRTATWWT